MIWIRSLLFQIYFYVSVCVFALGCVIVSPFGYPASFSVARNWGRSMLFVGKHLCGLDYVIEGEENIPDQASVIMIKHTTVFETYAQLAIFPPQTWVLKRELLWIPIFGWGLAAMRSIAINRGAGHTAVTQVIEQGKQRLGDGIWVTIFPEGTRMPLGKTRKYGISGAALAAEAQVPVVPVAHNAGDLWPRRGLRKKPGLIRVCIGPPITPGDTPPRELNLKVQDWVESKMKEISIGYRDVADG
jgi:1-acyl-sn-glycerol-3-phosphate acyltransferase